MPKHDLSLIESLKIFVRDNRNAVFITACFLVLAYGYFVTNWALSIDSEIYAEPHISYWDHTLLQDRFPFLYLLMHYTIMPFWNDACSVLLIFLSSLIMASAIYTMHQCQLRHSNTLFLVFLLILNISPVYTFFLRFTMCNLIISAGILLSAILFFRLCSAKAHTLKDYVINLFLLFSAITCYEMLVVYNICLALFFIILVHRTDNRISLKSLIKTGQPYLIIFVLSLLLLSVIKYLVSKMIPQSGYTQGFMLLGKVPFQDIFINLSNYFKKIFTYRFNFFATITLVTAFILLVSTLIHYKQSKLWRALLLLLLYISPLLMVILLGNGLPFRAMEPVVLVLACIWFLWVADIKNDFLLKTIGVFIFGCSLLNAQYINGIFYGDNMRFQYDVHFANQLYDQVVQQVGDSISRKPLVILGTHHAPHKPFILRSDLDTIGYSFFEWPGNPPYNPTKIPNSPYDRIYLFMSWLGLEAIQPTYAQYTKALTYALRMPNYPSHGAIVEHDDMIVVKLSAPHIWDNSEPISLDLNALHKVDTDVVHYRVDAISVTPKQLSYEGWGYFKNRDNAPTIAFLKLNNGHDVYYFPTNRTDRKDVAWAYKDGQHLLQSGFSGTLTKNAFKPGVYRISFIILNQQDYAEIPTDRTM